MNANVHYLPTALYEEPAVDSATYQLCVYCWPKLVRADLWDDCQLACCMACAAKTDRKCSLPRFALRDVR